MLIGYMRVSKAEGSQVLDLQRDVLLAAGGHVRLSETLLPIVVQTGCRRSPTTCWRLMAHCFIRIVA